MMKKITEVIQKNTLLDSPEVVAWNPLCGGNINQSYCVYSRGQYYWLRVNGEKAGYLNPSQATERQAYQTAGILGISPKLYASDENYLLTEFIATSSLSIDQCSQEKPMQLYTNALKRIHQEMKPEKAIVFSGFDLNELFLDHIKKLGVLMPKEMAGILSKADTIRNARQQDPTFGKVFCHNNYWQNNLLYNGRRVWVIDWKLSGYGDLYFDLARIPYLCRFSYEEEKRLLTQYFGFFEEDQWKTLQEMKYIVNLSEAIWAYFQIGFDDNASRRGINYQSFAKEKVEQLLATRLP